MKILHKDYKLYALILMGIISGLTFTIQGIIWGIRFWIGRASDPLQLSIFLPADLILILICFVLLWKFFNRRYFKVVPCASFAYAFTDGPWLTLNGEPDSTITINWITQKEKETKILFGEKKENMRTISDAHSVLHRIIVNDLKPGTKYFYKIPDFSNPDDIFSFETYSPIKKDFNFLVLGDTQNGGGLGLPNWSFPELLKGILSISEDFKFIAHVGDFTDQGNDLRSWHSMFNTGRQLFSKYPICVTMGNHDGGTNYLKDPDMKWYTDEGANFDYFFGYTYEGPKNDEEITPFKSRYYSQTYGKALFLYLDTKEQAKATPKNPQWQWLEQKLKNRSEGTITFVFIHRPLVSVGRRKNGQVRYKYEKFSKYILPILDKYGVNLIIQGHNHFYANFDWVLDESAPFWESVLESTRRKMHYIVTGGSGNDLRRNQPTLKTESSVTGFEFWENSSQYLLIKIKKDHIIVESRYPDNSIMHNRIYPLNED